MGHFHAKNISRVVARKLFDNWFHHVKDEDGDVRITQGLREEPNILRVTEVVDYLMNKIELVETAIETLENIGGHERAVRVIKDLMESEYAYNASEGAYTDREMIEHGVLQVVDLMQQQGLIEQDDTGGYFIPGIVFRNKVFVRGGGLKTLLVCEVEN